MSVIDRVVSAVTPLASDKDRMEARHKAEAAASPGDWLSMVLEHHRAIESAFDATRQAATAAQQRAALKELATLLTGHSVAEEAALYPALAQSGEKAHATLAYTEQSAAKMNLGMLETLPPLSQDFLDKLEHIRSAVAQHVYQEEGKWFLELKERVPAGEQQRLAGRYLEEFSRYMGSDAEAAGAVPVPKAARTTAAPPRG